MEKKNYAVTEKAGGWVAGKRSPGKGKPMLLTEEEARYPLIHGELENPDKKKTTPNPKTDGDK